MSAPSPEVRRGGRTLPEELNNALLYAIRLVETNRLQLRIDESDIRKKTQNPIYDAAGAVDNGWALFKDLIDLQYQILRRTTKLVACIIAGDYIDVTRLDYVLITEAMRRVKDTEGVIDLQIRRSPTPNVASIITSNHLIDDSNVLPDLLNRHFEDIIGTARKPESLDAVANAITTIDSLFAKILDRPLINLERDVPESELGFIINVNTIGMRNVIAFQFNYLGIPLPAVKFSALSRFAQHEIAVIVEANQNIPGTGASITRSGLSTTEPAEQSRLLFSRSSPDVKSSRLTDKAARILTESGIWQAENTTQILNARRRAQLQRVFVPSYTSDLEGRRHPPELPREQATSGLLPFVLVANELLLSTSSEESRSRGETILSKSSQVVIISILQLINLINSMSSWKRLLADDLEISVGSRVFGYFVQSRGETLINKFGNLLIDLSNNWIPKIEKFKNSELSDADAGYMERAMLAVSGLIQEFSVMTSAALIDSGSVALDELDNNRDRLTKLMYIHDYIKRNNSRSVLVTPLSHLIDAVRTLLGASPKNETVRVRSLTQSGELKVQDSSLERRLLRHLTTAINVFNIEPKPTGAYAVYPYKLPGLMISPEILDKMLPLLIALRNDISLWKDNTKNVKVQEEFLAVIDDLNAAVELLTIKRNNRSEQQIGSPWDPKAVKDQATGVVDLKNVLSSLIPDPAIAPPYPAKTEEFHKIHQNFVLLYEKLMYIFNAGVSARKGKIPKLSLIDTSATVKVFGGEFRILNDPNFQNLPSVININLLAEAMSKAGWLIDVQETLYSDLSVILRLIYTGLDNIKIDYSQLIDAIRRGGNAVSRAQEVIKIVLPEVVKDFAGHLNFGLLQPNDIADIGAMIYRDLYSQYQNVIPHTGDIANAIIKVVNRIPKGVLVDASDIADALIEITKGSKTRPTLIDLIRALIIKITEKGSPRMSVIIQKLPSQRDELQKRLAKALASVGGTPPQWTGIKISS